MSDHPPRIRIYRELDGEPHLAIRDSVNMTFYMRQAHRQVMQAVSAAVETYRRAVGLEALGWYVDAEGEWQELGEAGWVSVRQDLLQSEGTRLILAERPDATTGYEVTYRGSPLDKPDYTASPGEVTTLSFWLPTEYLEMHGAAQVRELALSLGAGLPFSSGHAGLAFHYNESLLGLTRQVRELCFQYPGMDVANLRVTSMELGVKLNGVYWMTFLGQPVLGELGGVAALRSRLLLPETSLLELDGNRAVVTLGPRPVASDEEPAHMLAPYRELASRLEPWLYLGRPPWRGFTEEDMRRWERRFLD
jgi:hypothetical protein